MKMLLSVQEALEGGGGADATKTRSRKASQVTEGRGCVPTLKTYIKCMSISNTHTYKKAHAHCGDHNK